MKHVLMDTVIIITVDSMNVTIDYRIPIYLIQMAILK